LVAAGASAAALCSEAGTRPDSLISLPSSASMTLLCSSSVSTLAKAKPRPCPLLRPNRQMGMVRLLYVRLLLERTEASCSSENV